MSAGTVTSHETRSIPPAGKSFLQTPWNQAPKSNFSPTSTAGARSQAASVQCFEPSNGLITRKIAETYLLDHLLLAFLAVIRWQYSFHFRNPHGFFLVSCPSPFRKLIIHCRAPILSVGLRILIMCDNYAIFKVSTKCPSHPYGMRR